MDKLEGYAQFPKPKDSNEQRVKVRTLAKNKNSVESRYAINIEKPKNLKSKSTGITSPEKVLSKEPNKSYDVFEFQGRLKENKRLEEQRVANSSLPQDDSTKGTYTSYLSGKRQDPRYIQN